MKSYPVQVIFREYFEGIVAAIFLAVFLRVFVLSILYIPASNMEPVLERGDFVLGWKLAYGFPLPLSGGERMNQKMPQRGDLVSFRFPGDQEQMVIRRVVAVPGDKVFIKEGRLNINGQEAEYKADEYSTAERLPGEKEYHGLKGSLSGNFKAMTIPQGQFFVLSDNRGRQDDSRSWGLVPLQNMESLVMLIWLSLDSTESDMTLRRQRMFQRVY